MGGIIKSSIIRKVAMALSGLFLVFFLFQHFSINLTSLFSPDLFNELSHFMGTNPVVQFALQPVLIFGVIFHFVMGFVLEIRNKKARSVKYASYNGAANASWSSRNMIYSGLAILSFLGLHFYDFWIHEMVEKYIEFAPANPTRYYPELLEKFESPIRTLIYVVSFGFLGLHLWHGFASSFQSVGVNNKYSKAATCFAKIFAIAIPSGFAIIAIALHLKH